MNRRMLLASAALLLAPLAAQAQTRDVSVTIYNSNLALVEDARPLDLKAGRQKLEFKDVSAAIRPETVSLSAPGVTILEQNFDYDLLTPDKLMEKAVGQQVKIVRTNPGDGKETTEVATVLAANEGVVLKIGDRIEVLRDDGVPTRVIFDKVPETLRARPTLSVNVEAASAGARQAKLSYLTSGLSWKADYVALFDEAKSTMDLQGWITLSNNSGTPFENARTQLVAGDVNQLNDGGGFQPRRSLGMISAGTESGVGERVADYYVYPLPERTTIAANQNKQVGFLSAQGIAAKKVYEVREGWFTSQPNPSRPWSPSSSATPSWRAWARNCRWAPCASTCATPPATRSSSARTRSATPRRVPSCRSRPARRSTSPARRPWSPRTASPSA